MWRILHPTNRDFSGNSCPSTGAARTLGTEMLLAWVSLTQVLCHARHCPCGPFVQKGHLKLFLNCSSQHMSSKKKWKSPVVPLHALTLKSFLVGVFAPTAPRKPSPPSWPEPLVANMHPGVALPSMHRSWADPMRGPRRAPPRDRVHFQNVSSSQETLEKTWRRCEKEILSAKETCEDHHHDFGGRNDTTWQPVYLFCW